MSHGVQICADQQASSSKADVGSGPGYHAGFSDMWMRRHPSFSRVNLLRMKSKDHERAVIFSEQKWFLQSPVWDGLSVGSDSLLLFDVIVLILVKG